MDKFAEIDKLAIDLNSLPKKERKRLKHQLERRQLEKEKKKGSIIKWVAIGVVVIIVGLGGLWAIKELSKPLPGQFVESQGRGHIPKEQWEKFQYNSNPPTSGPHDEIWARTGIYDQPQGDGHLVHSLEHGYVILSYNCDTSRGSSQYNATESTQLASPSAVASDMWKSQDCQDLKKKLSDLANEKRLWKLIVVPRPNVDSKIALTAWTYLEKLDGFDKAKIAAFIDAHRDHGPEQTME